MSTITPQSTSGQVATWNTVLSSSLVLAAITGVLYLLGGASYEGYSQSLGLDYLAGLQPAEYVFRGVEITLSYGSIFGSLILGGGFLLADWIAKGMPIKNKKRLNTCFFPPRWESLIFFRIDLRRIVHRSSARNPY